MTERLNERREEQARQELGATDVAPGVARALVAAFLLTIALVPALQLASAPSPWGRLFAEFPTACSLEAFELDLDDASVVGQRVLPPWQLLQTRTLGLGNEQVYPGLGGWLFHRPGVDYVTGSGFLEGAVQRARVLGADPCEPVPQPDPLVGLEGFADQLAARGIDLVVMPTPVKAVVAPEHLARDASAPVQNPSWQAFVAALESAGVTLFDPTPLLGADDYLTTDTHWRPEAMARVAEALAAELEARARLGPRETGGFARTRARAVNVGDLTAMLNLPENQTLYREESVETRPVQSAGEPWSPVRGAPVLLLGDSFSNIYSSREAFEHRSADGAPLDWGAGAGLAEQLSFALGRPVDRIVRNAGGAHATRVALAGEVAREAKAGRDRLAGVRAVVYQFAMRELALGDWKLVSLAAPPSTAPSSGESAAPAVGRRITGTLAARGVLPRPGTVPYPDALVALHLEDVEGGIEEQAVVYVWGMRDHAWTDAARWPIGGRFSFDVRPWDDESVQRRHATASRGELEDLALLSLPAYFGEPAR